jgi:hypothetical protein
MAEILQALIAFNEWHKTVLWRRATQSV